MRLALFDLDNTLLDGDSDIEWSVHLARFGAMDVARTRAYHVQYHAGTLDIDEFLAFQLAPLAHEPLERLRGWRDDYMRNCIVPRLPRVSFELVSAHARAGHELALVTATNSFLAAPIAAALAIPHVIATEPEFLDGRYTGRVAGVPCFRAGKITRVEAWLAARGQGWQDVEESWFYSDSHNDLPLLSRVDHAVAVDPDDHLRATAIARGWPCISLHARARRRDRSMVEPPGLEHG